MNWLKLIDTVLFYSVMFAIAGGAYFTIIACCMYNKAVDAPENFAKVLAAIREQVRWFRPGPHE